MFENCTTVKELNAALHAVGDEINNRLNAGTITLAEAQDELDACADKAAIVRARLWAALQRGRDEGAVAAAVKLGFSEADVSSGPNVDAAVNRYSQLKLAGLPVKGPEVDAAVDDINRVSVILSDAFDAYTRLHPEGD